MCYISINAGTIRKNAKTGSEEPPIRIAKSPSDSKPVYAHEVAIEGPSQLVYSPKGKILRCGARMVLLAENVRVVRLSCIHLISTLLTAGVTYGLTGPVLRVFDRLRAVYQARPYFVISHFAQITSKPQVVVSLHSQFGMISVYTYDDDQLGNALAEMNAGTLSHISGLPLVDRRVIPPIPTNEKDPVP